MTHIHVRTGVGSSDPAWMVNLGVEREVVAVRLWQRVSRGVVVWRLWAVIYSMAFMGGYGSG